MLEIPEPFFRDRTTIRLGGKALAEIVIEEEEDLERLSDRLKYYGGRPFFMGLGSNLLVRDGELDLVIVRINLKRRLEIIGAEEGRVLVRAQAGEPLRRILGFCLRKGLSGMEGLAGIPGSAGGAVMMNAGSFGQAAADCLHSFERWENGLIKTYKINDMRPGYRKLELPGAASSGLVAKIIFALTPGNFNVIFSKMNLNFLEKKSKQPISAWSGGCAFKNPRGSEAAGALLEKAGFKGRELGGMAFSAKHANFLINTGSGSPSAAFDLMEAAREEVARRFGVFLEPELKIIS